MDCIESDMICLSCDDPMEVHKVEDIFDSKWLTCPLCLERTVDSWCVNLIQEALWKDGSMCEKKVMLPWGPIWVDSGV